MDFYSITDSTLISRNPDPVVAEVEGEVVMMSIDSGKYHGLDDTGSRIWGLLERPLPLGKLIAQLQAEYEVDYETCLQETLPFLRSMAEHALLKLE